MAAFSLGLTSCGEDFEPTYLSEIQVSSSYVAIPVEGGTTSVTLNTADAWEITGAPEWLTIAPASGDAGETEVKFSAASTLDGRSATLVLTCAGQTQRINVIQGLAKATEATVAEIMSGPEKTYRVKGIVTKITESATYGNFYLNDGTSETDLYIYGTLYKDQKKQGALEKLGVEVGDEIVVEGPKTVYGTTVELVDVTVVALNKSLIKVESTTPESGTLPSDGAEFSVQLVCKGNGIIASVPEDAKSWLTLKSINGDRVVYEAAANHAGPRATTLVFKTTDGKKDYSAEVSVSQDGSAGTLEVPMTPQQAIEAAKAGVTSSVYVKGIVSKLVKGGFDPNYGNGSFWISEDGVFNGNLDVDFEAYQVNWLGNNKWADGNAQIEEGAEVIIYGPLTVYNGTAETQGKGAAYVYSVNGVTTDANGIGTLANPFNAVGGVQAANGGVKTKVYVQGTVCELVKGGFDPAYGNGSFWISDDGSYKGDKSVEFEAYQVNYLGGNKWNSETDPQIAVGDNVVIYGPLTVYQGTAETQGKGAAYIYSHNGKK